MLKGEHSKEVDGCTVGGGDVHGHEKLALRAPRPEETRRIYRSWGKFLEWQVRAACPGRRAPHVDNAPKEAGKGGR